MDKTAQGLHIQSDGPIWRTLVELNGLPMGVSRYHLRSRNPFDTVHVELDLPLLGETGVFAGALGVLTEADKTALEAFLGQPVTGPVPIHIVFWNTRHTGVRLADRWLPGVTAVEVWADCNEDATWVRWEGYATAPTADTPLLTVTGQLIAAREDRVP